MNRGHSRLIDVNGISLHYLEWGEEANPPLILLHGGSAHAHWWDHIAPSLAQTFRILVFDMRGHGDSSWITPPAYEIQDYVADLEAVITTLQLDSPSLLGHSLGGFIALSYATKMRLVCALSLLLISVPSCDRAGIWVCCAPCRRRFIKVGKTRQTCIIAFAFFPQTHRRLRISSAPLRTIACSLTRMAACTSKQIVRP